jgi:TPR repeat protein
MRHLKGDGVSQDYYEAYICFMEAAQKGLPEAEFNLALMYYSGRGAQRSTFKAERWFRSAMAHGQADALKYLVRLPKIGKGSVQHNANQDHQ